LQAYTHPIISVFGIPRNPPVLLHFKYCDPSLSSENPCSFYFRTEKLAVDWPKWSLVTKERLILPKTE